MKRRRTLVAGRSYAIYRWDGYRNLPASPDAYSASNYTSKHDFVSVGASYSWVDPQDVLSSGTAHYRCALTASGEGGA